MKLDNKQINALASKIAREIFVIKQQEYNTLIESKKIEMQSKVDADLIFVEALLSKSPVAVTFEIHSFPKMTFRKGSKVGDYQVREHFGIKLESPTQEQIKEDLILETIEETDINSLINTIKNKYVTN